MELAKLLVIFSLAYVADRGLSLSTTFLGMTNGNLPVGAGHDHCAGPGIETAIDDLQRSPDRHICTAELTNVQILKPDAPMPVVKYNMINGL